MAAELALVVGPRYFGLAQYAAPVPKPAGHSNTEVLASPVHDLPVPVRDRGRDPCWCDHRGSA